MDLFRIMNDIAAEQLVGTLERVKMLLYIFSGLLPKRIEMKKRGEDEEEDQLKDQEEKEEE